jgi:hypothetical protein
MAHDSAEMIVAAARLQRGTCARTTGSTQIRHPVQGRTPRWAKISSSFIYGFDLVGIREVGSRKSTPSMDNPQKRQSLVYMSPDGGEDGQPGEQILTKYTAIGRPPQSAAQGGEAARVRYIRSRAAAMD